MNSPVSCLLEHVERNRWNHPPFLMTTTKHYLFYILLLLLLLYLFIYLCYSVFACFRYQTESMFTSVWFYFQMMIPQKDTLAAFRSVSHKPASLISSRANISQTAAINWGFTQVNLIYWFDLNSNVLNLGMSNLVSIFPSLCLSGWHSRVMLLGAFSTLLGD